MKTALLFVVAICFLAAQCAFCQRTIKQSEKMPPEWLVKGLPKPSNNSFYYLKTETIGLSLDEARNECLNRVAHHITQKTGFNVVGEIKKQVKTTHRANEINEDIDTEYNLHYTVNTDTVYAVLRKIDEYWEVTTHANSTIAYSYHAFYAIAEKPQMANFDHIGFSYKYGADALWRSALIPGYGQIYKGHKTKGICIMAGEAALISAIVFSESQRSVYKRKSRETLHIDLVRNHLDNADNYATLRNVSIGGAAALYVYNLVDAMVTGGRKRTVVDKASMGTTLIPVASPNFTGVSFVVNF